jgi:hypothetical protein
MEAVVLSDLDAGGTRGEIGLPETERSRFGLGLNK